jgi:spore germination cell wall hydrolase CwlJ-like protein
MIKKAIISVIAFLPQVLSQLRLPALPNAKDIECLGANIYHEARGEPLAGKMAVAYVTLNRVKHPKFPKQVCQVVFQRKQFSWTLKTRKTRVPQEYYDLALKAYQSNYSFKAIYFHNTKVKPSWSRKTVKYKQIGNHVFYI